MSPLILSLAVITIVLLPMLLLGTLVFTWRWLRRRRKRRSPLTSELLRPPGFGLSERLDDLRWDLAGYLMIVSLIPATLLALFLAQIVFGEPVETPSLVRHALIDVAGGLLLVIALAVLVVRQAKRIWSYREGRDGELATAQLLEPIIAGGGRVLHDIQGAGFNIDHVVVAAGGVFAIETKHRMKPAAGGGPDNAKVRFDGKALHFPDWTDVKTAIQAAAEARWLAERLTRATGMTVRVRPIIELPGWFVENKARSDVFAINPKNCRFMLKPFQGEAPLDPQTIARIAFQVEQLCHLPDPGKRRNSP